MLQEIFKSVIAQDKDKDVPEFGGFSPHELKQPEIRRLFPDLSGTEALKSLRKNALRRALYFGYGIGDLPPVHFPNAEHFQDIPFTHNHWLRYKNMESEDCRVRFMLEKYQSRQFPEAFDEICSDVLSSENILQKWSNQIPRVNNASTVVYEQTAIQMERSKVHDHLGCSNGEQGAYQSEPVLYHVSAEGGLIERKLWDKALSQITDELYQNAYMNLPSFLHLYNRVKDPITPIRSGLLEQVEVFRELYESGQFLVGNNHNSHEEQRVFITQLALESSFLALPKAKNIAFVVYHAQHELPYIYIDATKLPRGEFADPKAVLDVIFGEKDIKKIDGILEDSNKIGGEIARITPITVSYLQSPYQNNSELFIVDGNNRGTSILLMQFFNYVNFDINRLTNFRESLRGFVILHDLDIEWERDLSVLLQNLSQEQIHKLLSETSIIKQFDKAKIPALLVQESSFHTIDVRRSKKEAPRIFLLQPMHQTIYNDARRPLAIPAKQQSHGRAAGNDIRVGLKL